MCGIFAILDLKTDPQALRQDALRLAKTLRHRGPDWSGIYADEQAILAHERLAIVDIDNGAQPLYSPDGNLVLAVNGEIYNHRELREELSVGYAFQTGSDCEVILALYNKYGSQFLDKLNGIFAFVLWDKARGRYLIGRDHIGIVPLYQGFDEHGNRYVASEMKALVPVCTRVEEFLPGQFYDSDKGKAVTYYQREWRDFEAVADNPASRDELRQALEAAVKRQLMCDVPYGVLLSGGLDSSITSALAKKYSQRRIEEDETSPAWWPQLHSFAIGLEGAPDLKAAAEVADHLGTVHHELNFTVQEGIDALRDVIYHLETYDVTTVRAATPMYLMARMIKAMGIKMVLSGEGSDELFGGYLYFHKAPNAQAFHEETVRKLDKLHLYDCLRANKAMAAWGVEARVPFLDKAFIDVAMRLNPEAKLITEGRIEKQVLREAFAHYLPESVAWRQKEQFGDGVGYSWIDQLKVFADNQISDQELENAHFRFPYNTPDTKEAYLYRQLFAEQFPLDSAAECVPGGKSVACSTPEALAWDDSLRNITDPSGRSVQSVHQSSY
ncbi:asparagine synthase (glutamine-hydrolyzing) [Ferrimonas balearica DSM 9799]|uniref:asparagine synthase (glutamine-hydrolyzing) n=1 Tax=Ferrimonas balearica (strain DSM 9799 / CCM 4581 / KCTC 23876 / PAT) TaxID=550540 RepID=E1SL75_FERBD|nr:asparagine synthase B [Ferrimonas balearica]ADN75453.1 asparagine synthase (glutamine-hydrolyzing) [Ferrimonas balearica DSM 9799]